MLLEVVDGVRVLLAKDGDEDVCAVDFLLAGRLNVQDRPLDYALETERRLGVDVVFAFDRRCVLADELGQFAA